MKTFVLILVFILSSGNLLSQPALLIDSMAIDFSYKLSHIARSRFKDIPSNSGDVYFFEFVMNNKGLLINYKLYKLKDNMKFDTSYFDSRHDAILNPYLQRVVNSYKKNVSNCEDGIFIYKPWVEILLDRPPTEKPIFLGEELVANIIMALSTLTSSHNASYILSMGRTAYLPKEE